MKAHVIQWLQAWLDGELDEALIPAVEAHLAGCKVCQQELESLEMLSIALHADDDLFMQTLAEQSEDDFVNSVMQRIHQEDIEQASFFDSWVWNRIPVALIGVWLIVQATWRLLTGLSTLELVAPGWPWLNTILQALNSGLLARIRNYETLGARVEQWLNIELITDLLLNPAALTTLITGLMFASWFCIWWLHQEKRNTQKHVTYVTYNGGY